MRKHAENLLGIYIQIFII